MKALYSNLLGGSITGKQLLTLVEQEFSVSRTLKTIYNTLHKLDLRWISCSSKHPKSDDETQALYKKLCKSCQRVSS